MIAHSDPLVTVIIPAYNAAAYLPKCIQSIQSQEYQNLEILVINDGSSDQTHQICKDFSSRDSRVVEISQQNAGVSAARNKGIQMASGQYIQFVDADDVLESSAIRRLVHCMTETAADVAFFKYWEFSNYDDINMPDNSSLRYHEYSMLNQQETFHWIHKGLITNNVWALFFDSDFLRENQLLFDKNIPFGEDILFIYQVASAASQFVYLSIQLYGYRNNPNSAVHQRSATFAESDLQVVLQLDTIQQQGLNFDPDGYPALRKRLLIDAYSMLPNKKTTQTEQDIADRIHTEIHNIGIVDGIQGLNTRYTLKYILIYFKLFDLCYALHAFLRR